MMMRRATFNLPKLDYLRRYRKETELRPVARSWRREDWLFMTVLLVIEFSGFLQEATGLIVDSRPGPFGHPLALLLRSCL